MTQGIALLLLSLCSSSALGLIKDLANQRVYFKHVTGGTSLPIYKLQMCNNRTSFSQHDGRDVDTIPKAIRKYCFPIEPSPLQPSIPSWNTAFLQSLLRTEIVDDQTRSTQESLKEGILVNLVSGGVRRDSLAENLLSNSWSVWSLDVRPFEDSDHDLNVRAHVGRHVQLLKHPNIEELLRNAANWATGTSPHKHCVIEFSAK